MEADMTTRSDTEAHDAVCVCPNDGTDPDCNYLPARLEAAWEALVADIADSQNDGDRGDGPHTLIARHRPIIEAALSARSAALTEAVGQLHRWDVSQGWAVFNAILADIDAALSHPEPRI